jgi:hypothetical protein
VFTELKIRSVPVRTLRDLSTGWIARYEIWSLASEVKCTVDHKFSLDSNEVWLQMKQTMCQREEGSEEPSGWGMQFPMAISKNARMFTILRTLYSLRPATSTPGLILETSILNLDFDGFENPQWSPQHDKIPNDDVVCRSTDLEADERFQRRDLYLYWFFFHPNSLSLLFISQDLQEKSMAAIFDLTTAPRASIINHSELNVTGYLLRHLSWCWNFNQVKVVYHPMHPLLGFSFAGRLYLWCFLNCKYLLFTSGRVLHNTYLNFIAAENPYPLCDIDPDSEISFNSNGTSVIFSDPLDRRKRITPIPHRLLQSQQIRITLKPASTGTQVNKWTKNTHWVSPTPNMQDLQRHRPSTPLHIQGQTSFQLHHSRDNNLSVQLQGNTGGSREFMKLPRWADKKQANINFQIPQSRDEMIRIILNKAAKPWYSMSKTADTHLPAVIQPEPRLFDLPGLDFTDSEYERGKSIEPTLSKG